MTFKSFLKGFLLTFVPCLLQAQTIGTIAGNGIQSFSGDGGPAINATLLQHWGMAVDASGNKYTCDYGRIRKISPSGIITTICGNGTLGFSGDGGPATAAVIGGCSDLAVDAIGNLYIADVNNNRIRKITISTGIITTVAGGGFNLNDTIPATSSMLNIPYGITVDAAGNLYIAENGDHRVRKVDPAGTIYTVAGTLIAGFSGDGGPAVDAEINAPRDVAVNSAGEIFILDTDNYRIRKIGTNGVINTISGIGTAALPQNNTPAITSGVGKPSYIAIDASSNLYFSTGFEVWSGYAVYVINTSGVVSRYAGTGNSGFSGDGGNASAAQISQVTGLAVGANGDMFIADIANRRIRKVTTNCTFPATPASITGPGAICLGSSTTYTASSVAGALSYQWVVPGFMSGSSTTSTVNVTSVQSTTAYDYIRVAAVNSCGAGAPATMFIGAVTMVTTTTPSVPTTFCAGQPITLEAPSNSTNWQIAGPITYQWKLNGTNIPGATGQSYSPAVSGNYSLSLTTGICIQTSTVVPVTINPTPTAGISGPDFFCQNGTATLTASPSSGVTYTWQDNGWGPISSAATYTTSWSGNYRVIVTNSFQCSDTSDNILVSPSPANAEFNNLGTSNLCYAYLSPPQFVADQLLQGSIYQWQLNAVNISGANSSTYYPTLPGEYQLIIIDSNGCADTSTWAWTLSNTSEDALIYTPWQDSACYNHHVNLEAQWSGSAPYQWVLNGVDIPGANSQTYAADVSGVYTLTHTEGTCVDTSDPVIVTILPQVAPVITQNGNDLSVPAIYNSYQWCIGLTDIPGATNNTYTVVSDGNYRIRVSDYNDMCSGWSATVTVSGLGVDVVSAHLVSIYPNPFVTETRVVIENSQQNKHTFVLYNVHGQECIKKDFTSSELTIDRGALPSGVYHFRIRNEAGELATGKLTIL